MSKSHFHYNHEKANEFPSTIRSISPQCLPFYYSYQQHFNFIPTINWCSYFLVSILLISISHIIKTTSNLHFNFIYYIHTHTNKMVQEKKVIDEVSGWLTLFDDGSVDRTWTGPPEVKFMSDPVPPHPHFVDGVATTDIIADQESDLKLRIYLPEKQENDLQKLPIILHFHGGGFCVSEANWFMYYSFYTRLARDARAVVVSVYLRRAPEHRLPASCHDAFAALVWLRSVAAGQIHEPCLDDQVDFGRVFLIGDSSGGNIVHQVAARAGHEDLDPVKLAGAILIHPGFCRSQRSKSELEQPETPMLTLAMLDKFLSLALPVGASKDHPITCPMGEALEGVKLPPYLYCVAEQDLAKDSQMEFYEAMKKAEKDVELLISNGVGHSFYLNKIAVDMDPNTGSQTQKLYQGITDFIQNLAN